MDLLVFDPINLIFVYMYVSLVPLSCTWICYEIPWLTHNPKITPMLRETMAYDVITHPCPDFNDGFAKLCAGTHFIDCFFRLWFKFDGKFTVSYLAISFRHIFGHATTEQLPWHVQNFVNITSLKFGWKHKEFSSKLDFDGRIFCEMGPGGSFTYMD